MSIICYTPKTFRADSLKTIEQVAAIIQEYQAQGFTLTLRQLHYQMVSSELQANTMKAYKRLGSIVNDAKLAGLLPWDSIEDRTRNLVSLSTWESPASIMQSAAHSFRFDLWADQDAYVEVWIEKDALTGVIEGICTEYRVPYFACRGNVSGSELWSASQRLIEQAEAGKDVIVLHLGDHDPSGIDMTRDNQDRLNLFTDDRVEVRRIALSIEQVRTDRLPPNPAKQTDSRFEAYERQFGDKSWELDALKPKRITGLIKTEITSILNAKKWNAGLEREGEARAALKLASDNWRDLQDHINDTYGEA